MTAGEDNDKPQNVLELVKRIQQGAIDPRQLSAEDRRLCVGYLTGEGYSTHQVAQILQFADRTVTRDRAEIRVQQRLERDPKLAEQFAGQLVVTMEQTTARIRGYARDRDTPIALKLEAERQCFDIYVKTLEKLQSMGFLPTAAQRVEAQHLVMNVDPQTLRTELEHLHEVQRLYGREAPGLEGDIDELCEATVLLEELPREERPQ